MFFTNEYCWIMNFSPRAHFGVPQFSDFENVFVMESEAKSYYRYIITFL